MSAKQDVLARLGGGNQSAGEAIVRFVEEALATNREEIARLTTEHNQRVAAFEERVQGFVSRADHEELQGEVADIRRRLAAAAAALGGAIEVHNEAVQQANPASVEAAQAATDEAEQAGSDIDARVERLETRVSELEAWRADVVDPQLQQLREDVDGLMERENNRPSPLRIEVPEVPAVPQDDQPAAAAEPEADNPPTRIQLAARDADPRNWNGNPIAWGLAVIGLVVGLCVGWWLFGVSNHVLWGLIAFLFVPVTAAVGFFGGGLIGHRLTQRQPAARPAEA